MPRRQSALISLNHLPGILLASMAECEQWIAAGLVPIAERRGARRAGRADETLMFDPEILSGLTDQVPTWRTHGTDHGHARRGRLGLIGDCTTQTVDDGFHRRRKSIIARARKSTGVCLTQAASEIEPHLISYTAVFPCLVPVLASGSPWEVVVEFAFAEPGEVAAAVLSPGGMDGARLEGAVQALECKVVGLREATVAAVAQEVASWRDELEAFLAAYDSAADRDAVLSGITSSWDSIGRIRVSEKHGLLPASRTLRRKLDDLRSRAAAVRLRKLRESHIREASGYERYASIFPKARSLGRKVLFLAGPTNSGKTHEALKLAAAASTAEILSPLRLLALEHYESLGEAGLVAGMVTGEERLVPDGATHIARTIETLDLNRTVDVCVVDEIQMLGDPNRGWAWTQAVVGAPARLVILTGAPEAVPLVEHLLAMTGETLDIRVLKRKGKLSVEPAPARLEKLMRGDAVVAFSRRDVHDLRTRLVQAGRTVATVYGALGPEVRRAEAARFRNGEAEVLVATDAIGMGLNIGPLRRVIFSTLRKFDGLRERQLSVMEIKQIAGRAGRFGHHDTGLVTALLEVGSYGPVEAAIKSALDGDAAKLRGKAYVRPNRETVLSASEVLETERLGRILEHLRETLVAGHTDLQMADMEETIQLATLLDTVDIPILDRLSYSVAPVDGRERLAVELLLDWARQHARGRVLPANFGVNADLVKLEARVKIATTWLWLAQRYPDVYVDVEQVLELRADLNARIEHQLIATSVARRRRPDHKGRAEDVVEGRRRTRGRKRGNASVVDLRRDLG